MEKSIVHLLDSEIVRDLQEALGENFMLEEPVDNITTDGDVDYEKELLQLALNHSDISLLTNIIDDLRELNPEKWRNLMQEELYWSILTQPLNIIKTFSAQEIMCIGKTLEQQTRHKFCKSNAQKAINANSLAQAFMGEYFLDIKQRPAIKRKQIQTLHSLAKKVIMDDEYKLIQLQVSLANAIHREKRNTWF